MKLSRKAVLGFGGFCVASALVGTVAFADTTNQTAAPSTQLQADRATMKQLNAENKQLSQEIKADVQAWKTANPNPFKQLTADEQSQVKTWRADIKSEQSTLKPLRDEFKTLQGQLKIAKQNKTQNKASISSLRAQMKSLLTSIKPGAGKIQADKQQIEALLPAGTLKAYYSKQAAFHNPLKVELATLKQDQSQLRTDVQKLKADSQNRSQKDTDIQNINKDLNNIISVKKQLLTDLSTSVSTSTASTN